MEPPYADTRLAFAGYPVLAEMAAILHTLAGVGVTVYALEPLLADENGNLASSNANLITVGGPIAPEGMHSLERELTKIAEGIVKNVYRHPDFRQLHDNAPHALDMLKRMLVLQNMSFDSDEECCTLEDIDLLREASRSTIN